MDATIQHADSLHGTLTIPPDKAICHRGVLVAALATGATELRPWPSADDCQRTLKLIRSLGVSVERRGDAVRIDGRGLKGLGPSAQDLACGESGTTFRLAAGVLAGQPFTSRLTAGPLLSRRPMRRIVEPLTKMGARLEGAADAADSGEVRPPLTIQGRQPLTAIRYEIPVASAQVKSAVLLAGLFASGRTTVVERRPTRDHTERMLRHFDAHLTVEGGTISLEPDVLRSPGTLVIPGDFSSAAFFLVAASGIQGSHVVLEGVSLNPSRTGLLRILARMGATVRVTARSETWEPAGTIEVTGGRLRGVHLEPSEVPGVIDELPVLMAAAATADGPSRFEGIGELRVKETDRIRSMVTGLQRLGARVREVGSETVEMDGALLAGGTVESAGDHRTAMSLAVAGLTAKGTTVIRDAGCVSKSFAEFFDRLRALTGSATVKTVDNS